MNLGAYDITIDFSKLFVHNSTSIYFKEGDLNTAKVRARLTMKNKAIDISGCNITIRIETSEAEVITDNATVIDPHSGIIEIDFKSNALLEGTHLFEVWIIKEESVKKSGKIGYRVLDSIEDAGSIEGTNEYPILISLISDTNKAIQNATEALNRANEMQTDIAEAINNTNAAITNAKKATSDANSKINELDVAKTEMVEKVDKAINNMQSTVETAKNEMEVTTAETIADINRAIAAGTQDLEVKEARKDANGVVHDTLKERLESDLVKGKLIEETKEGNYLSFSDTVGGLVSYLEVFGNTVQDVNRLQDIRSVGIDNGDGTYKVSILSVGENLFNGGYTVGGDYNAKITSKICVNGLNVITPNIDTVEKGQLLGTSIFFDKNNAIVKDNGNTWNGEKLDVPVGANHIVFKIREDRDISRFKVQEGTQATPYTQYEETRCDINLPCQLEKWDKLYWDKEENAWCVEKRGVTIYFTKNVPLNNFRIVDDFAKAHFILKDHEGIPICNIFKQINYSDTINSPIEGMCYDGWGFYVSVPISKLSAPTQEGLYKYLIDSNMYYKVAKSTSDKIVLPKDIQIKLNSFANKTHIFILSGEVDATVKATVNKSLASTVQANSNELNILSSRVADIEGLKESQDFSYETDKGYLVCKDTKNGVVKDMKLYGKSLVNSWSISEWMKNDTTVTATDIVTVNTQSLLSQPNLFKSSDTVTIIADITVDDKTNCYWQINYETLSGDEKALRSIPFSDNIKSFTMVLPNDFKHFNIIFVGVQPNNTRVFRNNGCMCVKGDHTQNPPGYFEGIASVGTGTDKIEVSSCNNNLAYNLANVKSTDGVTPGIDSISFNADNLIVGETYTIQSSVDGTIYYGGANCGTIKSDVPMTFALPSPIRLSDKKPLSIYKSNGDLTISESTYIILTLGNTISKNKHNKSDTKPLLYKDTDNTWKPIEELRGVDLNNCDTVDSLNNIYTVGVKEITLDGTQTNIHVDTTLDNVVHCNISISDLDNIPNGVCICDKFRTDLIGNEDIEHLRLSSTGIIKVFIRKTSLSTINKEGVIEYFKNNNCKVILSILNKKTYEVAPIDLQSYEDETMISFGSGVIAPYASWKITSYLPNFVRNLAKQVKQLQGQVYKTNLANFTVALNTLETKLRLDRLEAPTR